MKNYGSFMNLSSFLIDKGMCLNEFDFIWHDI